MIKLNNVTIVGGGTAGWLTALYCKIKLPNSNISLIESSKIGILGAGEGTTTHFVGFLRELQIDIKDIIRNAKGTIKNGIVFTNWNGDKSSYFHPFIDKHSLIDQDFFVNEKISQSQNLDNLTYSSDLSKEFKVKFKQNNTDTIELDSGYALHFDARLLASYLKTLGIQRGITLIDATVEKIIGIDKIEKLGLDNEQLIDTDFVFDCSGFSRLLIGKHFNSEWVSYKDHVPNNRAMPFFIENKTQDIPPYTEAIAMKYGWVWKIPVQGRFGCGYVFDSRKVSDEEIKNEIKENFGEVNIPTVFNFEPGCYKEVYKKNCLAVGLASGFIEPLEATSIWVSIVSLLEFFKDPFIVISKKLQKDFNEFIYTFNNELLSFIYFHYLTKKVDTDYWRNFKYTNIPPRIIQQRLKEQNHICIRDIIDDFPNTFPRSSVLAVGAGIKFFNTELAKNELLKSEIDLDRFNQYVEYKQDTVSNALDHANFIKKVLQ